MAAVYVSRCCRFRSELPLKFVQEASDFRIELLVFRRPSEAAVRHGFEDVKFGVDPASRSRRCMRTVLDRKRSRVPVCKKVGGKPRAEVPEQAARGRAASGLSGRVQRSFMGARLRVSTVSIPRFVWKESPDSVRSTAGVNSNTAAGSGSPSSRARSISAAARLPPADPPLTTMSAGSCVQQCAVDG